MLGTLILEDGTVLKGESFGAEGTSIGEIVFNTSMVGYQEILTDPSYANQIIVMTYPEIGNYGINDDDFESETPRCRGFIVKNSCINDSHYKSRQNIAAYLKNHGIIALEGLDTRFLTKKIREKGVMNCIITTEYVDDNNLPEKMSMLHSYEPNRDIVLGVSCKEIREINQTGSINLALIDYGCKTGIIDSLIKRGCKVTVFPANVDSETILRGNFDCVFLSNGPGDPSDCVSEIKTLENLIGQIPIFGICLGYQLLSIVLGAKTFKLKYGHRGANHPVINLQTKRVMMSSQNHGYAVDAGSLTKIMDATYKNLNDDTLEGFKSDSLKIEAVQFHPEANPGPTDAAVIFDEWVQKMHEYKKAPVKIRKAEEMANL